MDESSSKAEPREEDAAAIARRRKRQREYSRSYYYRKKSPFPHIFKNDPRRQLGWMFANVMNRADFVLLKAFFTRFTTTSCNYQHKFHATQPVRHFFPTAVDYSFLDQAVLHSSYVFATMPDLTAQLVDSKIIQCANEKGSTVSLTLRCIGTRLYELGDVHGGIIPRMQEALTAGRSRETVDPAAPIPSLPYIDHAALNSMRIAADPVLMHSDNIFLFKLDENHTIISVEQHWGNLELSLPHGIAPPHPPYAETIVPDIFPLTARASLPSELTGAMDVEETGDDGFR